jgi:hypothetical protein
MKSKVQWFQMFSALFIGVNAFYFSRAFGVTDLLLDAAIGVAFFLLFLGGFWFSGRTKKPDGGS